VALQYKAGNLLAATAEAVTNAVNTRGVMGKGIALQVKQRWPEVDRAYRAACRRGEVTLGRMHVVERGGLWRWPAIRHQLPHEGPLAIALRVALHRGGLDDLRDVTERLDLCSIAGPALGCGNGGLAWANVCPLIESALGGLNVDVVVYAPEGASDLLDAAENEASAGSLP